MPSGFKSFGEEEFDRVFLKETEIIDNFVGNRLWTWGNNGSGGLGDGTTTQRESPGTTAGGGTNWKQVEASGSTITLAQGAGIKTDGTLWTWGRNTSGELGDGTTTSRSSPGTTAGGGTDWKNCADIHASSSVAAIKTGGTLWTWGFNTQGQLGTGNTTARSSPGTTSGGGTNWKQASVSVFFMAAIKTDGTLWTWGRNNTGVDGCLGDNTTTNRSSPGTTSGGGTNWKQVSCGDTQAAAIKTDGTLWTWGVNTYGQLGTGNSTSRSSPGTTSGGGTNWKQVSCGEALTAAIKTDGTLWTWGIGGTGALGNGTTTDRTSPGTTSGGGTNWKQVSCGYRGGGAVKTDGTLWTWGAATTGSMGDGTTTHRSSPGTVLGNSNWKQVSAGMHRKMAIGD